MVPVYFVVLMQGLSQFQQQAAVIADGHRVPVAAALIRKCAMAIVRGPDPGWFRAENRCRREWNVPRLSVRTGRVCHLAWFFSMLPCLFDALPKPRRVACRISLRHQGPAAKSKAGPSPAASTWPAKRRGEMCRQHQGMSCSTFRRYALALRVAAACFGCSRKARFHSGMHTWIGW